MRSEHRASNERDDHELEVSLFLHRGSQCSIGFILKDEDAFVKAPVPDVQKKTVSFAFGRFRTAQENDEE
jgi:hypothetical protein